MSYVAREIETESDKNYEATCIIMHMCLVFTDIMNESDLHICFETQPIMRHMYTIPLVNE